MPIPQAESLIEKAKAGARLTPKERRHCVSYLLAMSPETTNQSMADIFKVSEFMIRKDRKFIREERAKLIKEDDVGLVIADIAMNLDRQVRDIERSKKKCKEGSKDYLEHCKAAFDVQLKAVKALQDLGYYPKNLGSMSIEKYEFQAIVSQDGSVSTRPGLAAPPREVEQIVDAEFEEIKKLPAPGNP